MAEIRALSIKQPVAYLAGVLAGDGYLSRPPKGQLRGALGLHVADEEFARTFAEAIYAGYGVTASVIREGDGYWRVRKYNGGGRFDGLSVFNAQDGEQRAAWLRGFFDAEGNASLIQLARGESSWGRGVAFYNTELPILKTARENMDALEIPSRMRAVKPSAGHLGTKPVYELLVQPGRASYERFAIAVGSSIARKQSTLGAIVGSYHPDIKDAQRQAGARGAATKRERAQMVRLPLLLGTVARHLAEGGHPGHDQLRKMNGYWSARRTLGLTHAAIVEMARALEGGPH